MVPPWALHRKLRGIRRRESAGPVGNVRGAVLTLLSQPAFYWPEDSYFHRRNREKLDSVRTGLQRAGLSARHAVREARGGPVVHVVNCGGSGSHFVGDVIAGALGGVNAHEVYPPSAFQDAPAAQRELDYLVYRLHAWGHVADGTVEQGTPVVVTSHYRPDRQVHAADPRFRVALLVRDPADVAVSRALRKEDYKQQTAPDLDELAYLKRQAAHVARYFRWALSFRAPILRYEDFVNRDLLRVYDGLQAVGVSRSAPIGDILTRYVGRGEGTSNFNPSPRRALSPEHEEILKEALGSLRSSFGYA